MFNLTVSEAHTYYVGEQGWLVHNQQIQINHANGKAAEVKAANDLKATGYQVVAGGNPSGKGHTTVKTPIGNRVIDILAIDPNGNLVAIEVKNGGATWKSSQISKDAHITAGNFKLVGENAKALPANIQQQLKSTTGLAYAGIRR